MDRLYNSSTGLPADAVWVKITDVNAELFKPAIERRIWLKKSVDHGVNDYRPGRSRSQKVVAGSRAHRSTANGKVSRQRHGFGRTA